MDSADRRILWELDANCRTTYERLGRKLGLSANAIRKRIESLVESGIILRFMVIPTNAMMDLEFVSAIVFTDGSEDSKEFTETLGRHPVIHHVSPLVAVKGGAYHIFGQYSGVSMLFKLGDFIRERSVVQDVKVDTLLYPRGEKVELSKKELEVLSYLMDSPRMQVSEIARQSGLSARAIRRIVQQMEERGGVRFTVRWDVNARGTTSFWVNITWDDKKSSYAEIAEWLNREFPDEFWTYFISALEPTMFARFVVVDLLDAYRIIGQIKDAFFVNSTTVMVCYSTTDYPWFGENRLREMISEAGF